MIYVALCEKLYLQYLKYLITSITYFMVSKKNEQVWNLAIIFACLSESI